MSTESSELEEDELPSSIILIDKSSALVDAWCHMFAGVKRVRSVVGDYFQLPSDGIVSPANSFGIMDGGLDLEIRNELGWGIQSELQQRILEKYHGEMPVGCAEILETNHPRWPYMIAAPTMRVPMSVARTLHAYLAFRAILIAIEAWNRNPNTARIDTLVCCGLGTGVGSMASKTCAGQMRMAFQSMVGPPVIGRFESIHEFHRHLISL